MPDAEYGGGNSNSGYGSAASKTSSTGSRDDGARDSVGANAPSKSSQGTDSKDKGTNNASREAQGNVQGTPSRGGQPNNTDSRSPGNVNSQPATQKMAGSTQKGLVDQSRITKSSITRDDGMRAPVGENAPNKTYPTAADNKEIQDLRDHLNRQQTDINALLDTIRGPNLVETNLIKQPYGPVKQGTINPELQARMDALIKANQPIVSNPSYFGDLPKAPIQNKTYPTVEDNQEIQDLKDWLNRLPDRSQKVGVLDAPRLGLDPTNGIARTPLTSPTPLDPAMRGRLEQTRAPGYGVPDVPQRGQVVAKTPGVRVNLPSSPPGPGTINDLLDGIQSGWGEMDDLAGRVSYPSEEGQIYGPQSLNKYDGVLDKIQDRVADRNVLSPGQILNNQTINDAMHKSSTLNASRIPASTPQPSPTITSGPETPPGPADWQQGSSVPRPREKPAGTANPAGFTQAEPDLQTLMDSTDPFAEPENDLYGRRTIEERLTDKVTGAITDRFERVTEPVQKLVESIFGKPDGVGRQPQFGPGGQERGRNPVILTPAGNTDLMTLLAEMQAAQVPQQDQMKLILSVFA